MTRRERLEARAERRRLWAGSREAKAAAAHDRVHAIADQIPFGQPILVGHHSEGRARRDQARMESGMRAAVDNGRMADRHAERAENIERHLRASIFSDDADAVEQLRAKADRLEADRDRWKAENAEWRRTHKAELAAMGAYDRGQSVPYPSYSLQNIGQRIREARQRADRLEREQADQAAGVRRGGRVMSARFSSSCADCGEEIEKGSPITYYRSTREAVHVECPAPAAG
jgi:DNA repair exonuclease SbcCD ATPase subunit